MRHNLRAILARVERLGVEAHRQDGVTDWYPLVARLQSARTESHVERPQVCAEQVQAEGHVLREKMIACGMIRR